MVNPFDAEATFDQGTLIQKCFITIETLSCWYSFESSCSALSDEYQICQGFSHFQHFCNKLFWPNYPPAAKGLNNCIGLMFVYILHNIIKTWHDCEGWALTLYFSNGDLISIVYLMINLEACKPIHACSRQKIAQQFW